MRNPKEGFEHKIMRVQMATLCQERQCTKGRKKEGREVIVKTERDGTA
jgi:hypothetical protein